MENQSDQKRASTSDWISESSDVEYQENRSLLEKYRDSPNVRILKTVPQGSCSWTLLTSLNLFVLWLTIAGVFFGHPLSDLEAIKKTRAHSPVYETFYPSLQKTTFNNSLFNYPSQTYPIDRTKAMDDEWSRISDARTILITRDDVLSLGKSPETRSRASPPLLSEMGYGSTAEMYHGTVDAFHQIQCLNTIRKHVYYNGPYGSWDDHNAHELHWTHLSHCFDTLLQNLKCNADVGVVTHMWMDGQQVPFPDLNLEKKCVDFESLVEWNEEHGMSMAEAGKFMQIPPPEDIGTLYPAPPELYMVKGVEFPEEYVLDHEVVKPKKWFSTW